VLYAGALSFQLYGDYIDTAEPVAINGRYLIPLLPLVAVGFIQAISGVFRNTDRRILSGISILLLIVTVLAGGGIGTYAVQSEPHWFWPGFGQESHTVIRSVFERITFPLRF
jgi:hypothetical protein